MRPIDYLIISYSSLPLPRPRSYQIAKLLKNLKSSYFVITSDYSKSRNLDFSLDSYFATDGENILRVKDKSDITPAQILFKIIPTLKQLPDNHWGWALSAITQAKSLKKKIQPKGIIAFSRPETDLLIGVKLKKIFAAPLVVHFSDPWVDNPYVQYTRFTRWANSVLEARVIKNADLILFTNDDQQNLVMKKYPDYIQEKARSIAHCYDKTLYDCEPKKSDRFIIRHIGNLYRYRSADPFIKAIHLLIKARPNLERQILVEFYGQISEEVQKAVKKHSLEHVLKVKPSVPYLESLKLMSNADLLLLIDAESARNTFFPSKLVDYMGAKRNILGVTSADGPTARIIKSYGGQIFSHSQVQAIKDFLFAAVKHRNNFQPNIDELKKYAAPVVACEFEKLVRQVMSQFK